MDSLNASLAVLSTMGTVFRAARRRTASSSASCSRRSRAARARSVQLEVVLEDRLIDTRRHFRPVGGGVVDCVVDDQAQPYRCARSGAGRGAQGAPCQPQNSPLGSTWTSSRVLAARARWERMRCSVSGSGEASPPVISQNLAAVWSAGARDPGTEAAARKALKAQRREENERNQLANQARRGDSSGHVRDSTGTPIGRRLMPVYLLKFCARPHGVSCAPRQCRTGVAHRVFGGLTCTGMPGGVSQEARPGHHRDAVVLRYASSRRARLALPPAEQLLARAASIEAKWIMHPAEVSAEEVQATQRSRKTTTRWWRSSSLTGRTSPRSARPNSVAS
jgi:hypothetical protein